MVFFLEFRQKSKPLGYENLIRVYAIKGESGENPERCKKFPLNRKTNIFIILITENPIGKLQQRVLKNDS